MRNLEAMMEASMMRKRNRRKLTTSFDDRLQRAALAAREAAQKLPQGPEREILLRKARQAATASRINGWLTRPGAPFPS
jgi:hypothetical protein